MRNPNPYCEKNGEIIKGAWSKQEDQKLIDNFRAHGEGCWRSLSEAAGLQRCGKSCRLRWINYLRPGIKRGNFAQDEADLIIKLHALLGNRWSLIAGRLPGRTDNEVKNFWNSHLRKKLIKMGIDPNNHRLNQTPKRHSPINNISSQKIKQYQPKTQPLGDQSRPVSDTGSCLEHESTSAHQSADSSNLNLDLSIAIPSADDSITTLEVQKPQNSNGMVAGHNNDIESDQLPTLILFR